jgi:hypothetical protein
MMPWPMPNRIRRFIVLRALLLGAVTVALEACGPDVPPFGYYAGPCATDYDCAAGTYCIEPGPGTCLVVCRSNLDCLPPYVCRGQKRRGTKGDLDVCTAP